jgi:hypothetical protein
VGIIVINNVNQEDCLLMCDVLELFMRQGST